MNFPGVYSITNLLSFLTLLGDIGLVIVFGSFLLQRFAGKKYSIWKNLVKLGGKYGLVFAFLIATGATVGSLFYSEFLGYTPCELCWLQRIFIYPQVIILGTSLFKKSSHITSGEMPHYSSTTRHSLRKAAAFYSLVLSEIGISIAAYQYYLQRFGGAGSVCSAADYSASCAQNFILNFGYVTIPMMSMTAFALIIASVCLYRNNSKTKN